MSYNPPPCKTRRLALAPDCEPHMTACTLAGDVRSELGDANAHVAWKQVHTDSLVADFLLRQGHVHSADQLADEANIRVR